jgi:uncharacterized C2H2 Zn-finger protein
MARTRTKPASEQEFKCPECGRTFSRAAALGAHRRQAHGVTGASAKAKSSIGRTRRTTTAKRPRTGATATSSSNRRRAAARTASSDGRRGTTRRADRDALLKALFPNGIPPREDIIRAINAWLDDADRLTRMA